MECRSARWHVQGAAVMFISHTSLVCKARRMASRRTWPNEWKRTMGRDYRFSIRDTDGEIVTTVWTANHEIRVVGQHYAAAHVRTLVQPV